MLMVMLFLRKKKWKLFLSSLILFFNSLILFFKAGANKRKGEISLFYLF